jgi:hypothetical protein
MSEIDISNLDTVENIVETNDLVIVDDLDINIDKFNQINKLINTLNDKIDDIYNKINSFEETLNNILVKTESKKVSFAEAIAPAPIQAPTPIQAPISMPTPIQAPISMPISAPTPIQAPTPIEETQVSNNKSRVKVRAPQRGANKDSTKELKQESKPSEKIISLLRKYNDSNEKTKITQITQPQTTQQNITPSTQQNINTYFGQVFILNMNNKGSQLCETMSQFINPELISMIDYDKSYKNINSYINDALECYKELYQEDPSLGPPLILLDEVKVHKNFVFEFTTLIDNITKQSVDYNIILLGYNRTYHIRKTVFDASYYMNANKEFNFATPALAASHWNSKGCISGRVGKSELVREDNINDLYAFIIKQEYINSFIKNKVDGKKQLLSIPHLFYNNENHKKNNIYVEHYI